MDDKSEKNAAEDVGAFRSLFATFFPKLRAMLMRQGVDRDSAEEIAQDTLFAVWRKTHQFSGDKGSVSAWIYAIARNLRIDRVRKDVVWQRFYSELETIERLHGEETNVQQWAAEKNDIEIALRDLPGEQLEIVRLSFLEGLSQSEIAERLGLPLGTVKSRLRLAFGKLRSSVGADQ
jgi:RNA polymerase sigma-70 factor (ECF subfamily)